MKPIKTAAIASLTWLHTLWTEISPSRINKISKLSFDTIIKACVYFFESWFIAFESKGFLRVQGTFCSEKTPQERCSDKKGWLSNNRIARNWKTSVSGSLKCKAEYIMVYINRTQKLPRGKLQLHWTRPLVFQYNNIFDVIGIRKSSLFPRLLAACSLISIQTKVQSSTLPALRPIATQFEPYFSIGRF